VERRLHQSLFVRGKRLFLLASWLLLTASAPAFAQAILERVVGPSLVNGFPLHLAGSVNLVVADMSRSTEVPMGLETPVPAPMIQGQSRPVLTGLTLRAALDLLVETAPEYEWHAVDGVVVIRPRGAASVDAHPLHQAVDALVASDIVAQQALSVACAWLGAPAGVRLHDRRHFSVSFAGGRLIELLNEAVRQHGSLVWTFTHAAAAPIRVELQFISGITGRGCSAPGHPKPGGVDVGHHLSQGSVDTPRSENVLDTPLPHGNGLGYYFGGFTPQAIRDLATAVRVPIGFESGIEPARIAPEGVPLRGNRLGDVLEALTQADPGFEWRVLDGVVVIRPRDAWNDSGNPLSRRVAALRLLNEPIGAVLRTALGAVGEPASHDAFPDSKKVWLDAPPGTVLDLLNAVVRAHGGLFWTYAPPDPDPAVTVPMRPRVLFQWPVD
jgi:hypothetical protein